MAIVWSFVRALVIEDLSKPVEFLLLEAQCQSRRPSCFFLERPMHSFVATVLLRTPGLDTFVNDPIFIQPSESFDRPSKPVPATRNALGESRLTARQQPFDGIGAGIEPTGILAFWLGAAAQIV